MFSENLVKGNIFHIQFCVDSDNYHNSKAKESVFSRAYFHFKSMEAVIAFHQGYDGHVFMDSRGKYLDNLFD